MYQGGGAVAEVVQADGGQPGCGHQGSRAVGEVPGVQWVAVADVNASGILPAVASGVVFLALPVGVLSQQCYGVMGAMVRVLAADFGGPSKTW